MSFFIVGGAGFLSYLCQIPFEVVHSFGFGGGGGNLTRRVEPVFGSKTVSEGQEIVAVIRIDSHVTGDHVLPETQLCGEAWEFLCRDSKPRS